MQTHGPGGETAARERKMVTFALLHARLLIVKGGVSAGFFGLPGRLLQLWWSVG